MAKEQHQKDNPSHSFNYEVNVEESTKVESSQGDRRREAPTEITNLLAEALKKTEARDPYVRRMMAFDETSVTLDSEDPQTLTIQIVYHDNHEIVETPKDFRIRVRKENLDPEGFWFVSIDNYTAPARIRVEWYHHIVFGVSAEIAELYYGHNGPSLYDAVVHKHPKIMPSNAAALGYELALAEASLKKGLGYLLPSL